MRSSTDTIIDALRDVLGTPAQYLPLHEPKFDGKEWAYVKDCIDTGWVSSVGSYVDAFGENLAKACGVKHAIPTVNGTAALEVSMRLAGVAAGDEVLMPALTFIATANSVAYCGAIPHLIECESATLGVDVEKLSAYLADAIEMREGMAYNTKTGRRIAAIVPVHIFGHPVNMDALQKLANHYHLPIVADAAEALGSVYKGKPAASFGLLAAMSFNGNKIITTGGGGAILTDDDDLAARARHLTTTAKVPHKWEYVHDELGYNYRMPNLNAAMGCAQLEQLDHFLDVKRTLAHRYRDAFSSAPNITFMEEAADCRSNYWLNAIVINDQCDRDAILNAVNDANYMCRPVWRLMHRLDMYKNCPRMDLSVSEEMEFRVLNLPSSAHLGAK